MIPLKDLNLSDRFLFDEVMEDPKTQRDILSIILGREIPLLIHAETEKELRVSPMIRSVRLDVFSMDEDSTAYNTEMQDSRKADLAKRSRYYQALKVSEELQEFLYYVEHTTDCVADRVKSERIKRIHERVKAVKNNEEVGVRYMQAWEEKYFNQKKAHEEGLTEGRIVKLKEQIMKKLQKGKIPEQIADELEEEVEVIRELILEIEKK